jgi:hypothetical protein
MVIRLLPVIALALVALGCSQDPQEANTQRAVPLTVDQQIAALEKRTDMPEDIKAQTIANLRAQAAGQQSVPRR